MNSGDNQAKQGRKKKDVPKKEDAEAKDNAVNSGDNQANQGKKKKDLKKNKNLN